MQIVLTIDVPESVLNAESPGLEIAALIDKARAPFMMIPKTPDRVHGAVIKFEGERVGTILVTPPS